MQSLLARPGRPGSAGSPYQLSVSASRRPTAARLRFQKHSLQHLVTTQQSSAPTQTPNDLEATEAAMREAKERVAANGAPTLPKPVIAEAEDLKAKFAKIQAEVSSYRALSVENGRMEEEIARLRQENEELASKLVAQQAEVQQGIEAARQEVAGPLQQQLEELSMQLQNSQAQLKRLGEAVEAAESDKAAAVQALREENQQLLLALEGATRRLADIVYPPGSLPAGLTISTRLEGSVNLQALLAEQQAATAALAAKASTSQSAAAAVDAEAAVAKDALATVSGKAGGESDDQQALAAATKPKGGRRSSGFLGKVLGFVGFWLYHVLGALLLYYAAAILRGAPPTLNVEFGLGCLLVCSLLPWVNRLLVPRFST